MHYKKPTINILAYTSDEQSAYQLHRYNDGIMHISRQSVRTFAEVHGYLQRLQQKKYTLLSRCETPGKEEEPGVLLGLIVFFFEGSEKFVEDKNIVVVSETNGVEGTRALNVQEKEQLADLVEIR